MRHPVALRAAAVVAATIACSVPGQDAPPDPPRVLLLGDSSLRNLFAQTTKALRGQAQLVTSNAGYLDSARAVAQVEALLKGGPWDVICCNIGRSDLMCRDPRTKAVRAMSAMAGGVPVATPEQHTKNLRRLIAACQSAGAQVVWITSLPLPPNTRQGALDPAAVAVYNAAASRVMAERQVPVVDLHAQVTERLQEGKPNPRQAGRRYSQLLKGDLCGPLVARLRALLGLPSDR